MKLCSVPGCNNISKCQNFCSKHYQQFYNHGKITQELNYFIDPDYNKMNHSQSIINRFFSRIICPEDFKNDCWEWIGTIEKDGYGVFSVNHKQIRTHRFSWEYYYGLIPNDKLVCHKCDHTWCVNPYHLFLGSHQDNENDKVNKNRQVFGSKNGRSILTEDDVKNILNDSLKRKYTSIIEISQKYNITKQMVRYIILGENWKHIINQFSQSDLKIIQQILL